MRIQLLCTIATSLLASACVGQAPDGPSEAELVARGKYLAENVSGCAGCHTPRAAGGVPDQTKFFAGVECFIDTAPTDNAAGCLHTGNLTNHASGLLNRTDAEIINMFQKGVRPDGTALFSAMPYWIYHNMTAADATAIVKYLRTVPGVDRTLPKNQVPFATPPPAPAALLVESEIPKPTTSDARTENGRYLVGMAGRCLPCHTPLTNPMDGRSLDPTKILAGGRLFRGAPPLPPMIYATNLTPHETGIAGQTAEQIKAILKDGVDKDGKGVCRPMPAGPMSEYAGLTDEDALDIGRYLVALSPVSNPTIPDNCVVP